MALLPPNQLLHLGPDPAGAGWNHFDLGQGLSSHINYSQSKLGSPPPTGPQGEPWWYSKLNADGIPVVSFSAPFGGATTTTNTHYARDELREYERDGTTKMAFDPRSGDHWIEGIYRIQGLAGLSKPEVCVQQMHSPTDDTIMVLTHLSGGVPQLVLRYNGTQVAVLDSNYVSGREFYLKTRVNAGTPSVYYSATPSAPSTTPVVTSPASSGFFSGAVSGWYSKSGSYNQTNELTDPSFDANASIIKVEVRELKHWHSETPMGGAWPTPAAYATATAATASAGADATILPTGTFSRTASVTLNGSTLTSQQWKIASGPLGVGDVLSSAALVNWTPSTGRTTTTGQTRGVGGIAAPAPASNVELNTSNRGDMNITASGTALVPRIYDGGGKTCGRITNSADYIIIQNYNLRPNSQYAFYNTGNHVTFQNCDIKDIMLSGDGDLNAITLLEGSFIDILYNTSVNYVTGSPGASHTDWIQTWVSSSHPTAVSNVNVIGNLATGPSNPSRSNSVASIHQCIMVESAGHGGNSGGSGTPSNWLIADNEFGGSWGQEVKLDAGNNFVFTRNKFVGSSDTIFAFVAGTGNVVYSDNTFGSGYGSVGASTTAGPGPASPGGGGGTTTTPYPTGTYVLEFDAVTSTGTAVDTVSVVVSTTAAGGLTTTYPTFLGYGPTASSDASGTITVDAPSGVAPGHFQICIIQDATEEGITSVPANWFLLDDQGVVNTDTTGQPAGLSHAFVYYNTTGDSASRSWSKSGTRGYHAVRMAWQGWSALGPHTPRGSAYTTTPYAASVTPGTNSALVVTVMCSDRKDIGPSPVSVPGGWSERYNTGPTVNTNEIEWIAVADLQVANQAPTGGNVPTGTGTATSNFTLTNPDDCSMFSFVLEGLTSTGVTTTAAASLAALPNLSLALPGPQAATLLAATAVLIVRPLYRGNVVLAETISLFGGPTVFPRGALIILPALGFQTLSNLISSVQLAAIPVLNAGALPFRKPTIRTDYKYPPIDHPFRLIAQRILDGEIIEWELPVGDDFEYVDQLSGPVVMRGSFRPEIISVQELNLDAYAYWLHVEINQQIRASAILLPAHYAESAMTFSAEGIAATPHYHIYDGVFQQIGVDPLSVVRTIWNYVQSQPQSDYGVQVSSTTSPVLLGTPGSTYTPTDRTLAAKAILDRLELGDPIFEDFTWTGCPEIVTRYNNEFVVTWRAAGLPTDKVKWFSDLIAAAGGATANTIDPKPYELVWWNATNCGEEIDTLSGQTPFDYVEQHQWNVDRTEVLHYIYLGYPRIGAAKGDLLFNEENILEVVPVQEQEDSYASAVLVIGSGEGADTIRGYAAQSFGDRVRKEVVITDKTISTVDRANARALSELAIRRGRTFEIAEIVINANHTNAPLGSYSVGDDIQVRVDIPWLMETHQAWYRITSVSNKPSSDKIRLGLSHTSVFDYSSKIEPIVPDVFVPFTPPPVAPVTYAAYVTLIATATLTADATVIAMGGTATLAATSTLTVGGSTSKTGAATLSSTSTLSTSSLATFFAAVSLAAGKTLTVGGTQTRVAAVSMSVGKTLSANGTIVTITLLGKTTDGTSTSISSGNKTTVSKSTATTTGVVVAGHARLWVDAGTAAVQVCVYADSAGAPGSLLGLSDSLTISNTAEALQNLTFTGAQQASITSGTDYWIGFTWADPGTNNISWSRDGTAAAAQQVNSLAPNPFGTPAAATGPVDAYVEVSG